METFKYNTLCYFSYCLGDVSSEHQKYVVTEKSKQNRITVGPIGVGKTLALAAIAQVCEMKQRP